MLLFCTSSDNLLDPAIELIARGEMCKRLQVETGDEVNWSKSNTASEDYQNWNGKNIDTVAAAEVVLISETKDSESPH